jgi:[ribosomal protein S18]-alanine N-acetyltransferase
MKLALCQPAPADYETIASWIPNAAACVRWAGPNLQFPFLARDLPELLAVTRSHSFSLVSAENLLVGFGQFWPRDERTVHLGRIIISPGHRGCGLGRSLLELLLTNAVNETKANRVTLRVYRDNQPAISIYSRFGFSPVDSESNVEVLTMETEANKIADGNPH